LGEFLEFASEGIVQLQAVGDVSRHIPVAGPTGVYVCLLQKNYIGRSSREKLNDSVELLPAIDIPGDNTKHIGLSNVLLHLCE
jgi:hypothetical protein